MIKECTSAELSHVSMAYHTKQGQHLNRTGKKYIIQDINKIRGNNKRKKIRINSFRLFKSWKLIKKGWILKASVIKNQSKTLK